MSSKKKKPPKIMKASQLPKIEFLTTGIEALDEVIRYPRGRISEIYGLQSVGKTSLMMMSIAGMTAQGHKVLYMDVENTFNQEWAESLGVDLEKLDISDEAIVEEVVEIVRQSIGNYDCIIVDTVAAMIPRAESEGDSGDAVMGLKARLMGQFMRMIVAKLDKSKCALVFVNQLRENLEIYAAKYSTPGGLAIKYAASVRIELKTTSKQRIVKSTERAGHKITATVTKSKVGKPHKSTEFPLMYEPDKS